MKENKKMFANSNLKGGYLNNKAFTLIELLAIIVILAIIAVITVPIILNIIENSRKGAATDSAYGYKDAVNKTYIQELAKPNNESLKLDGIYTVQNDGTLVPATGYTFGVTNYTNLPVSVSGDKPSSGSLTYSNNVLTSGCLVIGDYTVTYSNGTFTAVKTSLSSNEPVEEPAQGGGESENYTYYGYDLIYEDPYEIDFNFEDSLEPSNSNECTEPYLYYKGDGDHSAGCYYVNSISCNYGDYNYETGRCEYESYNYEPYDSIQDLGNKNIYLRNDGEKYEVCGVFGSGQASTVCLVENSNGYYSDFEDVTESGYYTSVDIDTSGLKGYTLSKAQEMLSKGASYCDVDTNRVLCYTNDGQNDGYYCDISNGGHVDCNRTSNSYGCWIAPDGTFGCDY